MEDETKEVIEHTTSETVNEMDEISEIENMKKVEAALFLSARFLTLQDLVMLTDVNPLMIRELIEKLVEKYNSNDSAIEIVVKQDMWKMDIGQEYVTMVNKLATGNAEFSSAEQETLAVIAYKQPVKQSVIIKIRGNKAYDHIKHFIEIGLVQSKKAGRTKELRLSDDFFEYFHLQKKEDGEVIGIEKNEEETENEIYDNSKNNKDNSNTDNAQQDSSEEQEKSKKLNIEKQNIEEEVVGE
tara:strand:+ start:11002 stop:11724 length:723 start_codon:yes stop_codon:yes gene_type:complete